MVPDRKARDQSKTVPLSWMGWSARLPVDWRPARIEGDWERGAVVVSDGQNAVMQFKWWHPRCFPAKPRDWVRKRVRRVRTGTETTEERSSANGFDTVAWAPGVPDNLAQPALWYGCSRDAGLVLEIAINRTVPTAAQDAARRIVLDTVGASAGTTCLRVAVFGAAFEFAPGSRLTRWSLKLGDLGVRAYNMAAGETYSVRQIFPARLALARRDLGRWLRFGPYKEHRRFVPVTADRECRFEAGGRDLEGVLREGTKALPFPLGWTSRRRTVGAVLHDPERDRLFLAECDSKGDGGRGILADLFRNMGIVA